MEEQKLTQEKVAGALGISQESVSRRVRGVFEWRPSELVIVAGLLGVTPADLFAEPAATTT
jgi:transcriptional regulator with XRE-family HTH domain